MAENNGKIQPIIKKVKKGGHGGHHGGSWKVAYADFVTAMMAFFLLLWLLSSVPSKKLIGIANYFTPTIGIRDSKGIGFDGGATANLKNNSINDNKTSAFIPGAPFSGPIIKMPDAETQHLEDIDHRNFTSIQHDLYKAIHDNPELQQYKNSIQIDQTPEGLRIQLLDLENKPMFIPGTAQLEDYTKKILAIISKYIKYMPNYLSINGHTTSEPLRSGGKYADNWELSSARANSTRKFLTEGYIDPDQIARVVGKADMEPYDSAHPNDPRNMRLTLILLKNTILPFQKQSATDSELFQDDGSKKNEHNSNDESQQQSNSDASMQPTETSFETSN